ncbi:hypothetical protein DZE40_000371 [Clostridium beijerinckii]|uniref:Uncharacterized protein n=1 Tax=Clostridium beijerinckii TaxID=1520 RepID=A0A1S8RYZ6_CLOBE|nr:hypothetical protein [Clostridium beijerinckii]OOM58319.1 hypothetical protein CLBCK_40620 [Clostridium beijerinckii]
MVYVINMLYDNKRKANFSLYCYIILMKDKSISFKLANFKLPIIRGMG